MVSVFLWDPAAFFDNAHGGWVDRCDDQPRHLADGGESIHRRSDAASRPGAGDSHRLRRSADDTPRREVRTWSKPRPERGFCKIYNAERDRRVKHWASKS